MKRPMSGQGKRWGQTYTEALQRLKVVTTCMMSWRSSRANRLLKTVFCFLQDYYFWGGIENNSFQFWLLHHEIFKEDKRFVMVGWIRGGAPRADKYDPVKTIIFHLDDKWNKVVKKSNHHHDDVLQSYLRTIPTLRVFLLPGKTLCPSVSCK